MVRLVFPDGTLKVTGAVHWQVPAGMFTTVVNIPAGTCQWTAPVTFNVPSGNTNLTIQGQTVVNCTGTPGSSSYGCVATDNTIIGDSYQSNNSLFVVTTGGASSTFR